MSTFVVPPMPEALTRAIALRMAARRTEIEADWWPVHLEADRAVLALSPSERLWWSAWMSLPVAGVQREINPATGRLCDVY